MSNGDVRLVRSTKGNIWLVQSTTIKTSDWRIALNVDIEMIFERSKLVETDPHPFVPYLF